jgi:hypothetical protein
MSFEWDETKNEINIRRHAIDFADVPTLHLCRARAYALPLTALGLLTQLASIGDTVTNISAILPHPDQIGSQQQVRPMAQCECSVPPVVHVSLADSPDVPRRPVQPWLGYE